MEIFQLVFNLFDPSVVPNESWIQAGKKTAFPLLAYVYWDNALNHKKLHSKQK